jgi:hypothetical protein
MNVDLSSIISVFIKFQNFCHFLPWFNSNIDYKLCLDVCQICLSTYLVFQSEIALKFND